MEVQNNSRESFKNDNIVNTEEGIPDSLLIRVESIAKREGFVSHTTTSKMISTNGGNYSAVLYLVDVKGKTKNGDKELNLFVKHIISMSQSLTDFMCITDAFSMECFVYKDLAKIFKQLEDKAGIPAEERYKIVRGFEESSSETIILENVALQGFKTCDRRQIGPLKFVELSIIQLAKFHALGFAIEKNMPKFFNETISKFTYPLKLNEEWKKFYYKTAKMCLKGIREDYKKKAEKYVLNATANYVQYYNNNINTIQTLCYGDFRALNILVKGEGDGITEIIPVDLQCIHYGCPANDIMYFIYGCTDREFRRQHWNHILDLYYDSLTTYLKYFDINVTEVCPRSKFDAALKERAAFGLTVGLGIFPFLFPSEDNYPDVSNDDLVENLNFDLDPQISRRIEEMIEDLDVAGLL